MEKLKDIVKSAASVWWVVDILLLPKHPWIATAGLATKVALLLLPLRIEPPGFVRRFMQFSMEAGHDYFPVTILWEDKGAFKEGTPYVIGYEPHSVLPQGICTFCQYATDAVPPALRNTRILVSSAGFWAPVMRHLWWWLGCRPVGRQSFKLELSQGRSVALCPGALRSGVQECLYMEPGKEIAYLRKRHGFVRTPSPSPELVSEYLTQFIDALEALFEKHKAAAGYPELTLTIY
eukprot:scaffold13.g409.t1